MADLGSDFKIISPDKASLMRDGIKLSELSVISTTFDNILTSLKCVKH